MPVAATFIKLLKNFLLERNDKFSCLTDSAPIHPQTEVSILQFQQMITCK